MKTFQVWVMLRRPPELPDQWEAFCLDLNVVTYGDSVPHALHMVVEAARMVLEDDLAAGRDPLVRRAPEAEWDELYAFLATANVKKPVSELREDHVQRAALTLEIMAVDDAQSGPVEDDQPRGMTFAECA